MAVYAVSITLAEQTSTILKRFNFFISLNGRKDSRRYVVLYVILYDATAQSIVWTIG